ncbi:GspH/FimT family pseudopilin [Photobacterium galatheae]|uniref:Type II secretion system protein H n=1 Tax=Photobacterium galatheae TaxID=1654360 RepID=A0A066RNE8_9GAMM|nr:GspH/FimT family pseudopilin [Photobacterium galatheae]KDM91884.1 hypothetical protein EA58_09145 [Photobacterium galatheae]MCM0147703.1 GspH/FimT family pseudopilin [Photobacterium galatheae]
MCRKGKDNQPERLHCAASEFGMTLLEIVVVLLFIVFVVSAAVPSFSEIMAKQRLHRLVSELEWLLVQAKSEAVTQGEVVQVLFRHVPRFSETHAFSPQDWQIAAVLAEGTPVTKVLLGHESVPFQLSRSFSSEAVSFDPLTGRPHSAGSLYVSRDQAVLARITFSNVTGRIYVCSPQGEYGYAAC